MKYGYCRIQVGLGKVEPPVAAHPASGYADRAFNSGGSIMRAGLLAGVLVTAVGCGKKPEVAVTPPKGDPSPGTPKLPPLPTNPLPEATVKAWRDAGFGFGWQWVNKGAYDAFGERPESGAIPAFVLMGGEKWKDGVVSKLPVPEIPFGLNLSHAEVTDRGLTELSNLKNLAMLTLGTTPRVTDAGLKELASHPTLVTLSLSPKKLTDTGLKHLAASKSLTALLLPNAENVTDAGLRELTALNGLTTLNLYSAKKVTNAGMKHVATIKTLVNLNLAESPVTDIGMKEIGELPNLSALKLGGRSVSDAGLAHLASSGKL